MDEFLTPKDIIGAALIISGCVIDQAPEQVFITYFQSCIRWPNAVCNSSHTVSVFERHQNSHVYEKLQQQESKYKPSIAAAIHYNNDDDDDDEEKMRKNVFINWKAKKCFLKQNNGRIFDLLLAEISICKYVEH